MQWPWLQSSRARGKGLQGLGSHGGVGEPHQEGVQGRGKETMAVEIE